MAKSKVFRWLLPFVESVLFALAIAYKLRSLDWITEFAVALVPGPSLALAMSRGRTEIQVFLHYHRRAVSVALVLVLLMAAASIFVLNGGPAAVAAWNFRWFDGQRWVLAVVVGYAVRRTAARAMSPDLVETSAALQKWLLYTLLTIVVIGAPEGGLALASYLAGCFVGMLGHFALRELAYSEAERLRRKSIFLSLRDEQVTHHVWKAFRSLCNGRLRRAAALARRVNDVPSRLIDALVKFEQRQFRDALSRLDDLPTTCPKLQAKVHALRARIRYALGEESCVLDELHKAKALDPSCPIVAVAMLTLTEVRSNRTELVDGELLRLLHVCAQARGPLTTVDDYVVNRAWGVNPAFFYDAMAIVLFRMGQVRYAEELSARAVQLSPRYSVARLHQGMIFAGLRASVDPSQRAELADVARIQLELAIRFAGDESVTAKRAREQLERLKTRDQVAETRISAAPPPPEDGSSSGAARA